MEHDVRSSCDQPLNVDKRLSLEALDSIRSLIINTYTSDSTISSILQTLTRSLQLSTDSLSQHHSLKLLTDLASSRTHLCPLIFDSIRSNAPLSAESLAALASIAERDRSLQNEIEDLSFVSLCFGSSVSVRPWLLRNAERLGVQPQVLLTVFLGFTKDPYPYVRKAALDGLVGLCKYGAFEDGGVIEEGCYCRAVELLQDAEDCVRVAAVCVVSEWGQMLVAVKQEKDKVDCSNVVFVQLCSVARDMSVGVRIEAFNALGKIQMVSEDILLQTLSKKVKKEKSHGQHSSERLKNLESVAGAFVHGLEDDFYQVRKSACNSLAMLAVLSTEFASQALNLLMDMLNDNSMVVRLEALGTLHQMATFACLKLQEIHMHMFLGTLLHNSDQIRSAARKFLKVVKLPNLELFRQSINGLLENLHFHHQDEVDIFSVLFYMGRNHGNFAACIIKEVSHEIEPVSEGELTLDSSRVAAFLVLSISAPLSHDWDGQNIPSRLFSYAVTLLGRISHALNDVMDQNTLLAYLSQFSRSSSSSGTEIEGKKSLHVVNDETPILTDMDGNSPVWRPSLQAKNGTSEVLSPVSCESKDLATSPVEHRLDEHDEVMETVNHILAKVKDTWLLVQSGFTNEALRILSVCKSEVKMINPASLEDAGALAFTLQYIRVVKLLAKVWGHILWKAWSFEMGELEILYGKVDRSLIEMRCRFLGFSKEEELHVLELILVSCILRLSKVEVCCYATTLKKLSTTISYVESLHKEGSIEMSDFVKEAKKTLHGFGTSTGASSCSPFLFTKLLDLFTLKPFNLCRRVSYINGVLDVPGNDSENPLSFVSGLPVAIPLEITLHNVVSENRLWLRMTMSAELTQFVFLDLNLLGGSDKLREFAFSAPFYRTPKASLFTLRVCMGMECLSEDVHLTKGCGGPKHELVYICQEKRVYLSMTQRD